ncbi:MAG: hypothetical protein NVSMB63_05630 [Sediminibacterium sp.]
MYKKNALLLLLSIFLGITIVSAQQKRIDTSMKIGKAGYKVVCSNKNPDKNVVTIAPIGFESQAREVGVEVKGRIRKAEVDDFNNDGFPDLVLYVYSGDTLNKGTVFGIASEKNQSFIPIIFPDLMDDPKLREGYKGHDEYLLIEGTLLRRFPLYPSDSTHTNPTGKVRQIQYRAVPGEKGMLKFKVVRSYETGK